MIIKQNFLGGGGCKTINLLWGEYGYFLELHIQIKKTNAMLPLKFPVPHVFMELYWKVIILMPERKIIPRNVKMHTKGSDVTNHAWSKNHYIDSENASAILLTKAFIGTFRPLSLGIPYLLN